MPVNWDRVLMSVIYACLVGIIAIAVLWLAAVLIVWVYG